uniref:Uncharacterized protein n=1 Tax=Timema poppense TaxID=170557 RepID=A0A7R9H068_TIMPO|nr:unnamed protein product [Timema poppensis]
MKPEINKITFQLGLPTVVARFKALGLQYTGLPVLVMLRLEPRPGAIRGGFSQYRILQHVQAIRLRTNYANGLGIRKVELIGDRLKPPWCVELTTYDVR